MPELSIVIPARNEPYLQQTIDDIFANAIGKIEVIVGLDGYFHALKQREGLTVVAEEVSIGQRAMTNRLVRIARAPWIMKVDAHCSFGRGFDRIMLNDIRRDTILSPYMLVLEPTTWTARVDKKTSNYYFDRNLVMQYGEETSDILRETMCLQGSCFMLLKELYWKLELGDETYGSWGSQGPELGLKAWLSGNKCMTTKNTYYAHLFRTTDADFPYDRGLNPGKHSNEHIKEVFLNDKWDKAVHTLDWLVERFNRPGDWSVHTLGIDN